MTHDRSSHAEWDRLRSASHGTPCLSPERERELLAAAQAGDRRATGALFESHLRLVIQIASRYERPGLSPSDLVNEGTLGLLEAIRRFDLTQQTRLSTYARWWIRARIREYAFQNRNVVGMPSTRTARVARSKLATTERTLAQELGRRPTRAELADAMHVPEADVASVSVALSCHDLSLSAESLNGHGIEPRDEHASPEEELAAHQAQRLLELSVQSSLASLGERDRMIVREHYLADEDASMAALGHTLGVSRQRISQIIKRVRSQLSRDLSKIAC